MWNFPLNALQPASVTVYTLLLCCPDVLLQKRYCYYVNGELFVFVRISSSGEMQAH